MVGALLSIVWLFSGCGKKEQPTPDHSHQEPPKQEESKKPAPQEPREDPRCAGIQYSTHTVIINKATNDPELRKKIYNPSALKMRVCDKVVWQNNDPVMTYHTATADKKENGASYFDTGVIMAGRKSKPIQFVEAGEFSYHCTPHPWMRGKVIVTSR
jgi:plastocyanin